MSTLNHDKSSSRKSPPIWTNYIPEKKYHADSATGRYISSGMLKEFRLCPAHYHALILGTEEKKDSDAFRIGRAVHKLVLEGEAAFNAAFSVGGPVNERTGRSFGPGTKTFDEWLRDNALERGAVLTPTEADDIRRARDAAMAHSEIRRLLSEGWSELSARGEMEGVPSQIRLDWLRPDDIAVDLKSVEDISRFEQDARRFGYLHQFAFYRELAKTVANVALSMTAVVLEKKPPFRAGVWVFSADTLEPYVQQNRQTLISLRRCREENKWPTGYEAPRNFPPAGIPPLWLN